MENLKCFGCNSFFQDKLIYKCVNDHFTCIKCNSGDVFECFCGARQKIIENTYDKELDNKVFSCPNADQGCTWTFNKIKMRNHESECKFRTTKCIGKILGIFDCEWMGQAQDIQTHFDLDHKNLGNFFQYFQDGFVLFSKNENIASLNLINAYNKTFVFCYFSNPITEKVYFTILLFGRKVDADNFYYEFTIKSPEESYRKIKFVENIMILLDNIEQYKDCGRCISLPFNIINTHLSNNKIHFRFVISKKEESDRVSDKSSISCKSNKGNFKKRLI